MLTYSFLHDQHSLAERRPFFISSSQWALSLVGRAAWHQSCTSSMGHLVGPSVEGTPSSTMGSLDRRGHCEGRGWMALWRGSCPIDLGGVSVRERPGGRLRMWPDILHGSAGEEDTSVTFLPHWPPYTLCLSSYHGTRWYRVFISGLSTAIPFTCGRYHVLIPWAQTSN
jgi:hypothetical protein